MFIRTIYDKVLDWSLYFIHGSCIRWPVGIAKASVKAWEWTTYNVGERIATQTKKFFKCIGKGIERGAEFIVDDLPDIIAPWYRIQKLFFPIKFDELSDYNFDKNIQKWLNENVGRYSWKLICRKYETRLYFRHTDDAMAFKLWWT